MSLPSDIKTVLLANAPLVVLLTGGVHIEVEEITRQNTPTAFDATTKEIKPCVLIKLGSELKISDTRRGVRTPVIIYFYQRQGYTVIDPAMVMVHDLLNEKKIGTRVWNIRFDLAVYQQRDAALDCALSSLRFVAARKR